MATSLGGVVSVLLLFICSAAFWMNAQAISTPRCMVITSNSLTVDVPFSAFIIVYDIDNVKVTLTLSDIQTGLPMTSETVTTTKGKHQEVKLTLTSVPKPYAPGEYYVGLSVNTSSPHVKVDKPTRLKVNLHQGHAFIQLNKVKVHPGDFVSGRVFSVNDDLRPFARDIRVQLLNPHGLAIGRTKAKPLKDIKLQVDGVFQFDLEVPTYAEPGTYHVQAQHSHQFLASDQTSIEVTDADFPTTYIAASTTRTILPTAKTISVSVSARYASGNAVVGKASVELFAINKKEDKISFGPASPLAEISGDGSASFSVAMLNTDFDGLVGHHLLVKTKLMDHNSGLVQWKEDVTAVFARSNYVIDVSRSARTYKPSLLYSLHAQLKDTEGNPVANEQIKIHLGGKEVTKVTGANGLIQYRVDVNGTRQSAMKFTLETAVGGSQLNTRSELVVHRENSPSGAYITITPPPSGQCYIGSQYSPEVTFEPPVRAKATDYGVMHYTVTSKGRILVFDTVPMMDNVAQVTPFRLDHRMSPAFYVAVFYVRRDGQIVSAGIWVNMTKGACENKIKLSVQQNVLPPGAQLRLKVNGTNGSLVSTQIIERRQLADRRVKHLTKQSLSELMMRGQCRQDGGGSATAVLYNAGLRLLSDPTPELPSEHDNCALLSLTSGRRHRRDGQETLEKTLNALTGVWNLQAMALSATSGFCISDVIKVTTRATYQDLQMLLPHTGKVNEVMHVSGLFYWQRDVDNVTAELQVENGVCARTLPAQWSEPSKLGHVTGGHQVAVTFPVVPLSAREHTVRIRVSATGDFGTVQNVIRKRFMALPAGVERKVERTVLLGTPYLPLPLLPPNDLLTVKVLPYNKDEKLQAMTVKAKLPDATAGGPTVLHGSGKVEIRVTGEPLGAVVLDLPAKGLVELVGKHPIGCGEQSMMRIGPLVYAVSYLGSTDQLQQQYGDMPEGHIGDKVAEGVLYMNRFRNESGAYSAWPGKDPSTWLTAYVVRVFAHASLLTDANNTITDLVCGGASYVAGRQRQDGSITDPVGIILMESMAGGLEGTTAMTAYAAIALLEVKKHVPECSRAFNLNRAIGKAINYLAGQVGQTNDTYTLSMMAYALKLANHSMADHVIQRLLKESVDDEGRHWKYWQIPLSSLSHTQRVNLYTKPVLTMEIEAAAYTLLALMEADKMSEAADVAMWLTSQHRSNGRFISTQDTVVGLQALTTYRSKVKLTDLQQTVNIHKLGALGTSNTEKLNNDARNLRKIHSYDITSPDGSLDVSVSLKGVGEVRVETILTYRTLANSRDNTRSCPFSLLTTVLENTQVTSATSGCHGFMKNDSMCLKTCYRYPEGERTNMAILHVGLHHLHRPNAQSLQHLVDNDEQVDHRETNNQAVIFYLNQIPGEENCVSFVVDETEKLPVNSMPVAVRLYDYHDPERLWCERFYQPNKAADQHKAAVETYFSHDNRFLCAEVPEPVVHDYLEGYQTFPIENNLLEDMFCADKDPANVYALNVTFTSAGLQTVTHNDETHYLLKAQVGTIIKAGPTDSILSEGDDLDLYVRSSWHELFKWVDRTLREPHLIVGTSTITPTAVGRTLRLHLDQGKVYIQRIKSRQLPKKDWKGASKATKRQARKNFNFLTKFAACKT